MACHMSCGRIGITRSARDLDRSATCILSHRHLKGTKISEAEFRGLVATIESAL